MGFFKSRITLTVITLAVVGLITWASYNQFTKSPSNPTLGEADTGVPSPDAAQVEGEIPTLDENCTISILNRTVRVRPYGTWRIDNIPANLGRVRARATCVVNGVTVSGQSAFFDIEANIVNGFNGDIPLGLVDPIPESLNVTAPVTIITSVEETLQLAVIATFSDGSTDDVTLGSSGTNYTSSNGNTATVSEDGLVTAVSSGTVLVSALNDGALGLLTIQVVLGGDTDGDGIPDDVELAKGLDPNDPVDALKDSDKDGLTNIEEFNIGTDFNNSDTDGDGIPDGEEVEEGADGFITNPLLVDSDGDGISDALEIAAGTDPNDPGSFDLAAALDSINVTPPQAVLTFNTIFGEASLQLTVTGVMTDGNTIDLTSTVSGTNYLSSNLNICNFGAEDGRVFAGEDGVCTVTTSNSGFEATSNITVRTFAPTALTSITIPGYANNVDVIDDAFAFVAAGAEGLQVVDVSNLEGVGNLPSGRIIGSLDTPGTAIDVKVVNNLAYIADGDSGLQIFDVTDPTAPSLHGSVDTPGTAQDVVISSNRAYIADGASGLTVIDITDPTTPSVIATVASEGTAKGVDVTDGLGLVVVVNGGPSAAKIFDVSDEENISIVGSASVSGDAKDVVIRGANAYVASFTGGLRIINFSSPDLPSEIGFIPGSPTGFVPRDFAISNQFGLAAEQLFPNAIPIVNISDPSDPIFSTTINLSLLGDFAGTGIALTDRFVYVTEESFVVSQDFKATGNTRLFVAQYLTIEDKAGVPPTVSITSPLDGSDAIEGSSVNIVVSAEDDVAVASVNLIVNGEVEATDSAVPYEFPFTIPVGVNEVTFEATAIDIGSNIGSAQPIIVNVLPDPPPTVNITSPLDNSDVLEGSTLTIQATATDNVNVAKVEFFVDDVLKVTDLNAPFSGQVNVPLVLVPLTIKAVATDNLGHTGDHSIVVNVLPDPPPTVTITSPNDGGTLIEGDVFTISASANDNVSVSSVQFFINDVSAGADFSSPFSVNALVPSGVDSFSLRAVAQDNLGRTGSHEIGVNVIPDPLTTVIGRVIDMGGIGVPDVEVQTFGLSSLTDASGNFNIPNVPTILGNVVVNASGDVGGEQAFGQSQSVPPVQGGTTDVGDIELSASSGFISVTRDAVGVEGSGIEIVRHSQVTRAISHMPASIFEVADGNTNTLLLDGFDIGLLPNNDPVRPTNVSGLHQNLDGTFLFTVSQRSTGIAESGVEQRRFTGLRHADIFRSTGDNNTLFMAGDSLGLEAFAQPVVDAISLMEDGSVLFSVGMNTDGVVGSAVDDAGTSSRGMNIYRSTGDGANELFLSAADLGLSTAVCCGNVDGIFYDENAGTLLFSVSPGTQGLEGTAVVDAQNLDTLDSLVFSAPGDGSNTLAFDQPVLGIDSGGVDALAVDADGDLLFSASPNTVGVAGSGIVESQALEIIEVVSLVAMSIFTAGSNGSNVVTLDGLSLGIEPGSIFGLFNGGFDSAVPSGDASGKGDGSGKGNSTGSGNGGQQAPSSNAETDITKGSAEPQQAENSLTPVADFFNGFGDSDLTALDILEDGSFVFTVGFNTLGRPGSAIEARQDLGFANSDIYRSTGDGVNELFIGGDTLGIVPFSGTSVDAISLMPDGSVLFSTDPFASGVPGSAVNEASQTTRGMNIYRSFGDGTNELFMPAEQLGLSGIFCCSGNVDGLYRNSQDGSMTFSVSHGTQGEPGSAVEAIQNDSTLGGSTFRSMGDGTNELIRPPDNVGIINGGIDALAFQPTPTIDEGGVPPTVEIQSPTAGVELIEGDTFSVEVAVSDDVAVDTVEIKAGEISLGVVRYPGAFATFGGVVVPDGVGPLTITATATDLGGNEATDTVDIVVIPDPGTTVIGVTVDENLDPVDGATVTTIDGLSATTAADGSFSIADVPTVKGDITVLATVVVNEVEFNGKSPTLSPIPGGTVDVGTIIMTDKPDTVLLFGDRSGDLANLETNLTNLGFEVLANVADLPEDLAPYGTIWHVGAFDPLTEAERTRLIEFVNSGRGLHLTGERPCCDSLNDSLELLMNDLVVGGGVEVGRFGDIGGTYPFNPDALGGITSTPNALTFWAPSASGGMGGIVGENVLVTGVGGKPVGGVWDCGDLVGSAGRVTLLMDVNWFSDDAGRQQTIENMHTFLAGAARCGAVED